MKNLLQLLILVVISTTLIQAKIDKKGTSLKKDGIKIEYIDEDEKHHTVVVKRVHNAKCAKFKMSPDLIWGKGLSTVPESCKQSYITTIGKISPMKMAKGIETFGELEVINFIKNLATEKSKLFIDTRTSGWYDTGTIPGAINIPFEQFDKKKLPDEFEDVLDMVGVTTIKGKYNFTKAKTLLLFCNGVWCPQSGWAIENLMEIGYPRDKLKWYRGGLYSWTQVGLNTEIYN